MEDLIKLGGNINLEGFSEVDRTEMVIVKKMVGSYAKDMSEKRSDFQNLKVTLNKDGDNFNIIAELNAGGSFLGEEKNSNIFMCLDKACKKVISQI